MRRERITVANVIERQFKLPLGFGSQFSQTPDQGVCELRFGRNLLRLENSATPREKRLLVELELAELPRLTLFNKADLLDGEERRQILERYGREGFLVSAVDAESLRGFLHHAEQAIGRVLDGSRP